MFIILININIKLYNYIVYIVKLHLLDHNNHAKYKASLLKMLRSLQQTRLSKSVLFRSLNIFGF